MLLKSRFVELFGDPVLNQKGYPIKKLRDIAEYWNGLTYKPEDVSEKGTIVLRSSNIQNSKLDFDDTVRVSCRIAENKFVTNNDILMCSRNGSAHLVGKVALIRDIQEPMSFGAFMMIIRSKYYPYLMTFFQHHAFRNQISTAATTTINQITGKMLDNVRLPVPGEKEMAEFTRFTNQLDKLKVILNQIDEKIELLKKSRFVEMFGDIRTESKYKGIKIGDICETVSGGTPSSKNPEYYQGTIPWVTTVALGQNHIGNDSVNTYITEDAIKKSATHLIPSGSILFGTRVGVGKSSITDIDICTNQDIVSLVNIDETRFNKLFIKIAIDQYQSFFDSIKKGATIKGIRTEDLKNITIPDVPKSIQDNYESIVYQLDKLKVAIHKELELIC